jgi:branched-chain amino acid transport system permease protein
LRGDYLAIATLGFGEIINIVIVNTESIGDWEVGGSSGLHGIPILANFFWVFACVVVCVVAVWRIAYSSKGKAFAAIRDDEIAAAAMGVNTTYYKVAAFVIGAFFAGVAGGLWATWFGDLDPNSFRFIKSFDIVTMVVLGGSGSVTGSVIAAAVLTILPEWLRFLAQYRLVIYSLLLIFMMLFRPEGLMGNRELFRVRRGRSPRKALAG